MKVYYIAVNNERKGPYKIEDLAVMQLQSQTLVWSPGMENWEPLCEVKELQHLVGDVPPPLPNEQTVNIETKKPLQVEVITKKNSDLKKSLNRLKKSLNRGISSIKHLFAKECVFTFKAALIVVIVAAIYSLCFYLYITPPKQNEQKQQLYNQAVAERRRLCEEKTMQLSFDKDKAKKLEELFLINGWNSSIIYEYSDYRYNSYGRRIIGIKHNDLIDKYLIEDKIDDWLEKVRTFASMFDSPPYSMPYYWLDEINDYAKKEQARVFWHYFGYGIFGHAALCFIAIIMIHYLIAFIKWVNRNK